MSDDLATLEGRRKQAWKEYFQYVANVGSDRTPTARELKMQALKATMRYKKAAASA